MRKQNLMSEIISLGNKQKVTLQKAKKQAKKRDLKLQKEKQRLDKAIRMFKELGLISTALAESRKRIKLDSGVTVEVVAGDHSIWIIDPEGDKIPLPQGSYAYQGKIIVVKEDGVIHSIEIAPRDTVAENINKLRKFNL